MLNGKWFLIAFCTLLSLLTLTTTAASSPSLDTNGTLSIEVTDPVNPLHAANKRYVDTASGTGDNLSAFSILSVSENHAVIDITDLPRSTYAVLRLNPAENGGSQLEYSLNGVVENTIEISFPESNCKYNIQACDTTTTAHCGSSQLLQSPVVYGGVTPELYGGCQIPELNKAFTWPAESTFEALVYFSNINDNGRFHMFATTTAAKNVYHAIFRYSLSSGFQSYHSNTNGKSLAYTMEPGKWTHVAFTNGASGTQNVYVDGVLLGGLSTVFTPTQVPVTAAVGSHYNDAGFNSDQYLNCGSVISYTRLYSRELSAAEILTLSGKTTEADKLRASLNSAGQSVVDFTPRDKGDFASLGPCTVTAPICV